MLSFKPAPTHRLKAWPFQNKIGVREYCEVTGKTDIHIFEQWCYLNTVNDESDFNEAMNSKTIFAFDHDTYKLLSKALSSNKYQVLKLS